MNKSLEAVIAAAIGVIVFNVAKVIWESKRSGGKK